MVNSDIQKPKWTRMRWLWSAIAIVGIIGTPNAIIGAFNLGKSNLALSPIAIVALIIRVVMVWFLLKLWWQFRPEK